MPSLENIVQVAEALEKSPVTIVADRCVAVRNRNASCRRCVSACPVGAIAVEANSVAIDASSCMGCGSCVAACPTEALVHVQPTDGMLKQAVLRSLKRNEGRAVIACARAASKRQADPERFAEVPCFSRIDEILLVDLVAQGAESVLLVDENCATCKNQVCLKAAFTAVDQAHALLSAHDRDVEITGVTGFPEEMRAESADGMHGSSRRGFLSGVLGAAKDTAKAAAKTTIENEFGYKVDEASIGERLRVDDSGRMPQLTMKRHETALNALDAIGQPASGVIASRLFGSVFIDAGKCNACGMCITFCPTRALKRDPAKKPSDRIRYFEFQACDCVQCGLCEDVCWKRAIKLSCEVAASQLYDFEPRVFRIASA